MNESNAPNREQLRRDHYPGWVVPFTLTLAFLLVHVVAPLGLSLLSPRYGWGNGRPGLWNLLALVLIIPGLASTIWMITVHYRASPDTFMQFRQSQELITPGLYSFSRNPMYLIELAFWFGWTMFYGSLTVLIGFLLLFVLFNFVLVPKEERDLEKRFGESYLHYKIRVPRWLGKTRRDG